MGGGGLKDDLKYIDALLCTTIQSVKLDNLSPTSKKVSENLADVLFVIQTEHNRSTQTISTSQ